MEISHIPDFDRRFTNLTALNQQQATALCQESTLDNPPLITLIEEVISSTKKKIIVHCPFYNICTSHTNNEEDEFTSFSEIKRKCKQETLGGIAIGSSENLEMDPEEEND